MKQAIAGFSMLLFFLAGNAQFQYGYNAHTTQLTSVDKAMLSISDKALMPLEFKYIYKDIKGSAFFSPEWLIANP